ncbi:MAG: lysophospholipid acyltransferase family protein [Thermogutta sp.]|nr:lysophospholipid acyltransferase family protein [Thermogutta sp.]
MSNRALGNRAAAAAIIPAFKAWMGTLQARVLYEEPAVDPAFPDCEGPNLYVFWHEYILLPFYMRGHCNLTMLLSRHRDADLLSQAAKKMGFDFVRGSTRRGGLEAIRGMMAAGKTHHLTITPDGPRGPRRCMAPGAIYLASRLNMPIVAMGVGYHRPWRLKSWDRFAVPRPFSRARTVTSRAWRIPRDLDREGVEEYRRRLEIELNRLTDKAERWASEGTHIPGERPFRRRSADRPPVPVSRMVTSEDESCAGVSPSDVGCHDVLCDLHQKARKMTA